VPGDEYDAVVVGSGPNGLVAANVLADAGASVHVIEAQATLGGGTRTEALTRPGFLHDVCSCIHPLAAASPGLRSLELERYGLVFRAPELNLAHPLPDGSAAVLANDLERTAESLGRDGTAWKRTMRPFVDRWEMLFEHTLRPIRVPVPPILLARFAAIGLRSSDAFVRSRFEGCHAQALFSGIAAHSMDPLDRPVTAAFGLMLAVAGHAVGWPVAEGGSAAISRALTVRLGERGGTYSVGTEVTSMADLPRSRVVLFDLTPRQIARIAGDALPRHYLDRLRRFRYGPGVCKLDWALRGPIPWRAEAARRAGTVHVVGTLDELLESERAVAGGKVAERPFVLVAQPSLFDPTRAPPGRHTGWAYCHVPNGSGFDATERVEAQIERFAPGFRELVIERHVFTTDALEAHDANLVGGDIGGGSNDLVQFLARPFPRWNPYATPNPRLFLCSSSTPPGGGTHGMCGYWAAEAALKNLARRDRSPRAVA
jgi:phytoene dehydrogenase-like protein